MNVIARMFRGLEERVTCRMLSTSAWHAVSDKLQVTVFSNAGADHRKRIRAPRILTRGSFQSVTSLDPLCKCTVLMTGAPHPTPTHFFQRLFEPTSGSWWTTRHTDAAGCYGFLALATGCPGLLRNLELCFCSMKISGTPPCRSL